MKKHTKISNRVVLITGAGSGIGLSLAKCFLNEGSIVISLIHRKHVKKSSEQYIFKKNQLLFFGDITSQSDIDRLIKISLKKFGRIDVLINNAGVASLDLFLQQDINDWIHVIDVNLVAVARLTQKVIPIMIKLRFGRIINIASRSAEKVMPGTSAYSTSKAALIVFTKAIAQELKLYKKTDVLINAIIPGVTKTKSQPIGQDPSKIFPYINKIINTSNKSLSGRVFYRGRDYQIFKKFNS